MTCKNCIHHEVCEYTDRYIPLSDGQYCNSTNVEKIGCPFIDKSKIVKLPCKIGDIFYGINETSYDTYCVYGFKYGKSQEIILITTYDMEFVFGKEAFLTKEEAEAKFKELNNNAD